MESIALLIGNDKTIEQAKKMLDALFDGKNMVSKQEDDFTPRGYSVVVDYYSKDRNHILKVVRDAGFTIDTEYMAEWDVE